MFDLHLSEDVLQSQIVVGSDEIEEMKEYIYFVWMVNMFLDINVEILHGLRPRWIAHISINDVLKAKLNKILWANLLNSTDVIR